MGVLGGSPKTILRIWKTTTTPHFPGSGACARVVVVFPLKGLIGLGGNLKVDSRGGFYIPTATPRIVESPHQYSLSAACGVAMPR
jgi:hypothetical protein